MEKYSTAASWQHCFLPSWQSSHPVANLRGARSNKHTVRFHAWSLSRACPVQLSRVNSPHKHTKQEWWEGEVYLFHVWAWVGPMMSRTGASWCPKENEPQCRVWNIMQMTSEDVTMSVGKKIQAGQESYSHIVKENSTALRGGSKATEKWRGEGRF